MAQTLEERLRSRLSTAVKQVAEEMSTQAVSGYLVKRLVVEGSFRNLIEEDGAVRGFQVRIKNRLGVATVVGCTPLKIDGEVFPVDRVVIEKNKKQFRATEISESLPLSVSFGDEMLITVEDEQGLESGKHSIELGLKMVGLGIVRASYDDTLAGEGRPRVRRVVEGAAGDFADVMRRTIEMAAGHIGADMIASCAKILDGITLDLTDIGEKYGVRLTAGGEAEYVAGGAEGGSVLTIRTTKSAFHNMAHGKLNAGIAYARGDVRLEGVPLLKLRGMDPLITSIFRGYRAASEGIEFDEAPETAGGGVLEQMLGIALTVFDEILKALDKALGAVGVKYFYEKSLNRMELVWDALDREMRRMLEFGRARDESEAADAEETAPKKKTAPGAPAKSLQDRLRERITSVVETAVAEFTRSSVSGYLVKRLMVPGSFRNYGDGGEPEGFEVRLKNKLGVATVIGFTDVQVDGETFALDVIEITKGGRKFAASEISDRQPLSVSFGDELLIRVKRPGGIAAGRHKISLGVDMVGLGGMDVDYEEELSA